LLDFYFQRPATRPCQPRTAAPRRRRWSAQSRDFQPSPIETGRAQERSTFPLDHRLSKTTRAACQPLSRSLQPTNAAENGTGGAPIAAKTPAPPGKVCPQSPRPPSI
jgi:hypothetical protein